MRVPLEQSGEAVARAPRTQLGFSHLDPPLGGQGAEVLGASWKRVLSSGPVALKLFSAPPWVIDLAMCWGVLRLKEESPGRAAEGAVWLFQGML